MPTAKTSATLAAYGIDLIDKNDAGAVLLRLFKQIAHTARTHTNKHFNKIRT